MDKKGLFMRGGKGIGGRTDGRTGGSQIKYMH